MKIPILFQLVLFLIFVGCSNRALYEGNKQYQAEQCRKELVENCGDQKSYDEYKNEREKLLNNDS